MSSRKQHPADKIVQYAEEAPINEVKAVLKIALGIMTRREVAALPPGLAKPVGKRRGRKPKVVALPVNEPKPPAVGP